MTSGRFKTVPTDLIWVNREKRQRRELVGIEELAASISRNGLIHPPVIRSSGELVVGERRWTAIKTLGWTSVPVQFIEELEEHEVRRIELEENVKRIDLAWPDQCNAVAEYHTMRKAEGSWTTQRTAAALGFSVDWVEQRLAVAAELAKGNSRVSEAPKFSVAKNIVKRDNERRRSAELETLAPPPKEEEVPILNEDFRAWVHAYDGPRFNLIHCDFPYGVNADKHDQGAAAALGGYEDSKGVYFELIETLDTAMKNVVDESAHLIFWFSMDYYQETLVALDLMGWSVNPFPLVWMKSDNSGILPDPNRGPRRVYETAFFASRGDRKIVQAVANAFAAPVTKEFHMSEKSLPMLQHFFRMVCDEYSTVLDPTCGGGNALIAASGKAQRVLGLERSPEFFGRAADNWKANKPAK